MIRIAFICWDYYPYSGACTNLLSKILKAGFKDKTFEVHVITSKRSMKDSYEEYIDDIHIHRVLSAECITANTIKTEFSHYPFESLSLIWQKALRKRKQSIDYKKSFIDFSIVRSIYNRLLGFKDVFNVVIPIAGYYETVAAALMYKEVISCRLITYQVDPCSTNHAYDYVTYNQRATFEEQLIEQTDKIITTPLIFDDLKNTVFKSYTNKIILMEFPNIVIDNERRYPIKKGSRKIQCIYTGRIYKNARNPKFAINIFSKLTDDVEFKLVGVDSNSIEQYMNSDSIGNNIKFVGVVSYDKTREYVEQADYLVNIGNIMLNQVPSKLFEYISTGKPIINLCVHRNCPSLEYLKKYPYVLNLFEEDSLDQQAEQLRDFLQKNIGKTVSLDYVKHAYRECTAQYCAELMKKTVFSILKET